MEENVIDGLETAPALFVRRGPEVHAEEVALPAALVSVMVFYTLMEGSTCSVW